jgi:hypothetical protein
MREQAAAGDPWSFDMDAQNKFHQMISVKGYLYASGPLYKPKLPAGKTWARLGKSPGTGAAWGDQLINVFEPATLKSLMARAKRSGSTPHPDAYDKWRRIYLYKGTITFAELYALSPTFRRELGLLQPRYRDMSMHFSMGFYKDGLPGTVLVSWELGDGYPQRRVSFITRYGYQSRTTYAAPAASHTAVPDRQPLGDDILDAFAHSRH